MSNQTVPLILCAPQKKWKDDGGGPGTFTVFFKVCFVEMPHKSMILE